MLPPGLGLTDIQQRAIRLGLGVLLACFVGYGVILPGEGVHVKYRKPFSQACKWAAITCVVVTAPVIGKVAQTGVERMVGTIAGGWMGYATYIIGRKFWDEFSDGVVLSIMAAIIAAIGVLLGKAWKLDNSAKLFTLTFLLVTFGSSDLDSGQGALVLTITRITGICSGVILTEILAVLVFPRSSTSEALTHLRTALKRLTELNAMAWQHGPLLGGAPGMQQAQEASAAADDSGTSPKSTGLNKRADGYELLPDKPRPGAWAVDMKKRQEEFEAEAEKALMETYNALYKLQDCIAPARSEIYVGKLRQQLCFLPGLPWLQMGSWALPEEPVQALATSIRRTARLLWTVHLSFQEGFDENMMGMLQQQYPRALMPQLFEASQGALADMLNAFPNAPAVRALHLHFFVTGVEGLLRLSDYQRRRIMKHMKGYRSVPPSRDSPESRTPADSDPVAQAREDAHPRSLHSWAQVGSAPPNPPYLARTYTTRPSLRRPSFSVPSPPPSSRQSRSDLPNEVRLDVAESAPAGGGLPSRAQGDSCGDSLDSLAAGSEVSIRDARVAEPSLGRHQRSGSADGAEARPEGVGGPEEGSKQRCIQEGGMVGYSRLKPLDSPFGSLADLHAPVPTDRARSQPAPTSLWKQGTRVRDSYVGSPDAVLKDLPSGLRIHFGTSSSSDAGNLLVLDQEGDDAAAGEPAGASANGGARHKQDSDLASVSFRLQRVDSDDLIEFPETADGYVSKVRWYSFQFLMEELAEELEEMHAVLGDVLQHLPRPFILE